LKLNKAATVRAVCRKYMLTIAQVAELNPDISARMLRSSATLPRGFVIKLPAAKSGKGQALAALSPTR
ncbi:hypothetical protein ACXYUI_29230, partial [Klebsiella pneumoniae]